MSVLVIAIIGWVAVWAAASVYYSLRPSRSRLRFSKGASCWFESRGYGYLDSRGGNAFSQLDEARSACIASPTCLGITITPWDGKHILKTSTVLVETFDGQKSLLKKCAGHKDAPEEEELAIGEEERPSKAESQVDLAHWEPFAAEDGGENQYSDGVGKDDSDEGEDGNHDDQSEVDRSLEDSDADNSAEAEESEEEDQNDSDIDEDGDSSEEADSTAGDDDEDASEDTESDNAHDAEPDSNLEEHDEPSEAEGNNDAGGSPDEAEKADDA